MMKKPGFDRKVSIATTCALALLLAFASPDDLNVIAVTTVCGNVPLALTERNARMMCDLAGKTDMPVYAGAEAPMQRELRTAEACLLYTSPSPRDRQKSRMPSSA